MLLRNFTGDCFETLKEYCEMSQQLPALRAQSWYQFARLVHNCLPHTHCHRFHESDLEVLP